MTVAHHWRTIRGKLALSGIADPLVVLPDMHALLDVAELLLLEGMDAREADSFIGQLYRPAVDAKVAPPGFDVDEQLASFDAFEAAYTAAESGH